MLRKVMLLISLAFILSGCVTSMKLADVNRSRLDAVHMNDEVSLKQEIIYMGPGAAAFGAIGAMTQTKPGILLRDKAADNGIHIKPLVRKAMHDALSASGKVKLMGAANGARANLNIQIRVYGFSVPHGLSRNLVPRLDIKAEMLDDAGKTIWTTAKSLPLSNCPVKPIPAKAYWDDVENIRHAWTEAARHVASAIVDDL